MFKLLHKTEKQTYTLLSIGERGSGKTVFLTACHLRLHQQNADNFPNSLKIETEDVETQKNLSNILDYVAKTGQYPPATMKISNFEFSFKQLTQEGMKTMISVRWWDTPGESCKLHNPAFLNLMVNCDGCCLFIDGNSLVNSDNTQILKKLFKPLLSIAEIIYFNGLNLPLAVILTKCDLLENNQQKWQKLETIVQPIKARLDALNVNYQIFYSQIPIISEQGILILQPNQTSKSILWLIMEARKAHPEVSLNYQNSPTQTQIFAYLQPYSNFVELQTDCDLCNPKRFHNLILFYQANRPLVLLSLILTSMVLGLVGIFLIEKAVTDQQDSLPIHQEK